MDAATEKKKPGTAFPQNPPAQSIYGRGATGAQPVPTPALPAAPARNTAFPQNVPARSIYDAPQGNTGVGALVDSIFAPKAQEAAPPKPTAPSMATGNASQIPTGGPAGWTGGAQKSATQSAGYSLPTKDFMPDTRAVLSESNKERANLMAQGRYGAAAGEAFRGAFAVVPAVAADLVNPLVAPAKAIASGAVDATQQFATGEVSPAAAVATTPASVPAATTPANNPLRVQEAKLGVQNPGNAQAAGAPGATKAPITSLGQGQDVGFGVTRFDVPGQSPLFTNMTDAAGMASNQALMNRGAVTPQNQAAMDALLERGANERAAQRAQQQFAAEAAQAQAGNATGLGMARELDGRMQAERQARTASMDMRQKMNESPQAYDVRMRAMQEAQRLAATQGNATADRGFNREKFAAEQQTAQARIGIDQQRLGIDQQRATNDAATGAQTREAKGMEISAARQLAGLQAQYMAATDPKVKQQLARQLATLSGKYEGGMKPQVIRGADTLGDGGQVIRGGERLIGVDPETGQVMDLTPGGAQTPSKPAAAGQKYEVGQTVPRADGAKARVLAIDENGQPTKFQIL